MADVAMALRKYLLAKPAVSAIVGQRIYPDVLKQNCTLPAICYSKISTTHEHTLSALAGLAQSRIEFNCYALEREDANNLAEVIQQCGVIAFKGLTNGVDIRGVYLEDGQQTYAEPPTDGNGASRYVTSFDLIVHYQEGLGT